MNKPNFLILGDLLGGCVWGLFSGLHRLPESFMLREGYLLKDYRHQAFMAEHLCRNKSLMNALLDDFLKTIPPKEAEKEQAKEYWGTWRYVLTLKKPEYKEWFKNTLATYADKLDPLSRKAALEKVLSAVMKNPDSRPSLEKYYRQYCKSFTGADVVGGGTIGGDAEIIDVSGTITTILAKENVPANITVYTPVSMTGLYVEHNGRTRMTALARDNDGKMKQLPVSVRCAGVEEDRLITFRPYWRFINFPLILPAGRYELTFSKNSVIDFDTDFIDDWDYPPTLRDGAPGENGIPTYKEALQETLEILNHENF